jgi:hypothetical protein
MGSDNPTVSGPRWTTPENQQERPGFEQWVVGFTDGEGCFSISVVRNSGCRLGWQVQHEFSVTQGAHSRNTLELLREYFGCGTIIENRRTDDHRSQLLRFSVKRRSDLIGTVIPFFVEWPLLTAKRFDFELFARCLDKMQRKEHLELEGMREIASLTEQMNRKGRSRFLESSETIRQPSR